MSVPVPPRWDQIASSASGGVVKRPREVFQVQIDILRDAERGLEAVDERDGKPLWRAEGFYCVPSQGPPFGAALCDRTQRT